MTVSLIKKLPKPIQKPLRRLYYKWKVRVKWACIDVVEHVLEPKALLRDLTSHIKKGGFLIITNLYVGEILENHPMHFKVEFGAEEYLKSLGFHKGEFPWLWVKS